MPELTIFTANRSLVKRASLNGGCELNPPIILQKKIPPQALMDDSPDETAFFRRDITGALRQAGFVAPDARPFDFLHPWTPGALASAADRLGAPLTRASE